MANPGSNTIAASAEPDSPSAYIANNAKAQIIVVRARELEAAGFDQVVRIIGNPGSASIPAQ